MATSSKFAPAHKIFAQVEKKRKRKPAFMYRCCSPLSPYSLLSVTCCYWTQAFKTQYGEDENIEKQLRWPPHQNSSLFTNNSHKKRRRERGIQLSISADPFFLSILSLEWPAVEHVLFSRTKYWKAKAENKTTLKQPTVLRKKHTEVEKKRRRRRTYK